MKLIAVIRPKTSESFTVEAESYEAARLEAESRVPDGYELVSVRADKS
ncbi:hypothetical protein [Pseudoclavibacter helvolus]